MWRVGQGGCYRSVIRTEPPWSHAGLVVEDNSVVADAVAEGLRDQGMAVDVAYDGRSGLERAVVNTYDVVVLDRDLPGLHGDKLCEQIVASPCPSRVLMLTAAAQVEDRVEGLNLGADDYLAKPFDFSELVARVRALARRSPSTPPTLVRGDLIVDRARLAVTRAGRPVLLARKELADTFDDMLDRLDLAFASQRRFVANASHELWTPLTSMRTLIDVAMAKPTRTTEQLETLARRVRGALDQSEAIIDGLLTLARSDRGLTTRELVDLEAAAQDAIDQSAPAARASNILIEADLSATPALGDRVLVERLVANLVDNAVRYNTAGGSVRVQTWTDHNQSYLSVSNTGQLVPEPKVASLFEPFTRLEQRVTNGQGGGLGLSIVASVVAAHNGHLEADAIANGGLKITVRFPTPTAP